MIELTPRPKSLLTELRKLVARDTTLDGVLVKSVSFDEENNLVLSGRQDHEGQAKGAVDFVEKAAALAWKGLAPPKATRVGSFAVFFAQIVPQEPSSALQYYKESDGVSRHAAYYDERSRLVLAGRVSKPRADYGSLEGRIKSLISDDADIKLAALSLETQKSTPSGPTKSWDELLMP